MRFGNPGNDGDFVRVFPFRRPWPAIVVLAVMVAVFAVPAVTTGRQVAGELGGVDSLFDLVGIAFMGFWLIGWSVGLLMMGAILGLLLFGREVLRAGPNGLEIVIGLPMLGLGTTFDVGRMRNLRVVEPQPKSGKSWRGRHFEFDYGANAFAFGSAVDPMAQGAIASGIEMASGKSIREGDAVPGDVEAEWDSVPQAVKSDHLSTARVAEPPVTPVAPAAAEGGWLTPVTLALVIANLVPVAGAVFFGWRLSDVMVLYWAESAVVGFWNLAKILVIGRWLGLFAGLFFLGHFGGFMAVHFLFIYTIFIEGVGAGGAAGGGDLADVGRMFLRLWPALLALFLSHGLSFWLNFVGRAEYRGKTVNRQMSEPYRRIVFMHLVLIFGGGLALVLGDTTPVLLLVIALKIVFDVRAHRKEHAGGSAKGFVERPD
ncbi:MAG: DUF6498-containing protein [Xanthomonadales bacterium]